MRIQLLSEKTGISKRNIHFYIKEKLLFPNVDSTNGYYDFSEDDYKRLILIKNLRNAGFSIAIIRALFKNPTSAEYYFRTQIGKMEQEIENLKSNLENLHFILEKLPINPNFSDLYTFMETKEIEPKADTIPPYDGRLVNHFLWRTFWQDEALTEYQQFLWDKINKLTDSPDKNIHFAKLHDYLCSQNPKKIDALYKERNAHFNRIAELSEKEVFQYAEEMKSAVKDFIHNYPAVKQWKEHYHSFIVPQMNIYTADIGHLAEEMSPFFRAYKNNSTKACGIVYEWLNSKEGQKLHEEILNILNGFVNLACYNHAELESMNTIFEY